MTAPVWGREIGSLRSRLYNQSPIPRGLIRLLEALEREEPSEIALALTSGRLAGMIQSLDEVSLQLGGEFATELRQRFEQLERFQEAAAIDLVADRLRDELTQCAGS